MGYFEIGVYQPRTDENIGTLWRSAYQLGAAGIFTIGRRYRFQTSDTQHTQLQIPLRNYLTLEEFMENRPQGAQLVGIEMGGTPLSNFTHPLQAIYLLGSESMGLPAHVLARCNAVVSLESVVYPSYNVAVSGSIVLYHRVFLSTQAVESEAG